MTVLSSQVILQPVKRSVTTDMKLGVGKAPPMGVKLIRNATLTATQHAKRISDPLMIAAHATMANAYMVVHKTVTI